MNQVISNTGVESPCSTKGESCRLNSHRSYDLAQDGELALRGPQGREPVESVEPLCARLNKRRGLH